MPEFATEAGGNAVRCQFSVGGPEIWRSERVDVRERPAPREVSCGRAGSVSEMGEPIAHPKVGSLTISLGCRDAYYAVEPHRGGCKVKERVVVGPLTPTSTCAEAHGRLARSVAVGLGRPDAAELAVLTDIEPKVDVRG